MKEDIEKMIRDVECQVMQTQQNVAPPLIGICGFCDRKLTVHEFRDIASFKEFIISGMCQKCQDKTFEEGK